MTLPSLSSDERAELRHLEAHCEATKGNLGIELADRLGYLRAKGEGYHFLATFKPLVASLEDPLLHTFGEATTWDCSEDAWRLDPDTRHGIIEAAGYGLSRLDADDVLKTGRTAPQAVRDWAGPFLVTVTAQPVFAAVVEVRVTGRWSTIVSVPVPAGVADPQEWALEHADTSDVDYNEAEHESENFEVVGTREVP